MTLRLLDAAREELWEAVARYDQERNGLGDEFAEEVEKALQRVQDHPEAWPKLTAKVRCCRTDRFPYGIIYTITVEEMLVVAVAHLHRKPGYWRKRLR